MNTNIRLTPLNFATAFFLFVAIYSWIYGVKLSGYEFKHMSATIGWIFILFAFVVSFMDIMFRNFFHDTKKIWIVELSFITLAAIIFLLVK
jgi:uncharacterized membrane protein